MVQSPVGDRRVQFSMAEAGWPLRTETFYYSHRKGGPQVLPVDVAAFVRSLLPRPADDDYRYLAEHSYEMGPGFKAAIVQTDALDEVRRSGCGGHRRQPHYRARDRRPAGGGGGHRRGGGAEREPPRGARRRGLRHGAAGGVRLSPCSRMSPASSAWRPTRAAVRSWSR